MPHILKNKQFLTVIAVTFVIFAFIAFSSNNAGNITLVEMTVAKVVAPLQNLFFRTGSGIHGFIAELKEIGTLRKENRVLNDRIIDYEKQEIQLQELTKQNDRLKSLLEFKTEKEKELVVIGANVIGKNSGNWFNLFIIDKGKRDGIEKNMAVVTNKGMAGRIIEVGGNYSKVLSIIDGRSSISGIVDRTRDNGVVRGNNIIGSEDGRCIIKYLPIDSEILVGDKILTSGLGGLVPKGLVIGEIIDVERDDHQLLKHAVVKPAVEFYRLEEVLVVISSLEVVEQLE